VSLAQVRKDAATIAGNALSDDVSIVDHLPDSITPPCVLVAWSDPWLKPSTYCAYDAAMELIVVAQRIEPGGKLETLEEIVSALVVAFRSSQIFGVIDATSPYPLQVAGVDYLAATVNLQTEWG